MVTQTQNFIVHPNGVIKGGAATYTIDTSSGTIQYSGKLNLKWPISDKNIGPAEYTVNPNLFQSANLQQVGYTVSVGAATFKVYTIDTITKTVSVFMTIADKPVSGYIKLDVSKQYFMVMSATATVKIPLLGTMLIQASPVDSIPPRKKFWRRVVDAFRKFFKP